MMQDKNKYVEAMVSDQLLLMDLQQNGELSMIRLFDNTVKDLKLSSYHISYSTGLVSFFFI